MENVPEKILFESESLSGYSAESFRTWQRTTRSSADCSGTSGTGLMFENHSQATRYTGPLEVAPTVLSTYGTGGNNQPFVVEKQAFGICSKHSNSMMSDNPHSGFYETDTSKTIDTGSQSPCGNQGGMVVIEGNGSRPSHYGDGYRESDTMYTLNTVETHAIAFSQDTYNKYSENLHCGALRASGGVYGGGSEALVCPSDKKYTVRRLTPQECALLQGMPIWWCDGLKTENPTNKEIDWWYDVFETHRNAVNPDKKPKSHKQIEKWLKNPYSDSAAYKMWGNGIALPCAWFVLAGIAYYAIRADF